MLEQSILAAATSYLAAVRSNGLDVDFAVVFGSQASGKGHQWSDIDMLVVSPQFDVMHDRKNLHLLWRVAARVDSRIEPIPCGSRQWLEDDSSAVIELARRQGEVLSAV